MAGCILEVVWCQGCGKAEEPFWSARLLLSCGCLRNAEGITDVLQAHADSWKNGPRAVTVLTVCLLFPKPLQDGKEEAALGAGCRRGA